MGKEEMKKSLKQRHTLVRNINDAFGPTKIRDTATRLKPLKPGADFLDITNTLGFLESFTSGNLAQYKKTLTIPGHIRRFLTLAFRTAVLHEPDPMPLRIAIVPGKGEAVRLAVTDRLISIILTRSKPSA
jgi:hypothetical protein